MTTGPPRKEKPVKGKLSECAPHPHLPMSGTKPIFWGGRPLFLSPPLKVEWITHTHCGCNGGLGIYLTSRYRTLTFLQHSHLDLPSLCRLCRTTCFERTTHYLTLPTRTCSRKRVDLPSGLPFFFSSSSSSSSSFLVRAFQRRCDRMTLFFFCLSPNADIGEKTRDILPRSSLSRLSWQKPVGATEHWL